MITWSPLTQERSGQDAIWSRRDHMIFFASAFISIARSRSWSQFVTTSLCQDWVNTSVPRLGKHDQLICANPRAIWQGRDHMIYITCSLIIIHRADAITGYRSWSQFVTTFLCQDWVNTSVAGLGKHDHLISANPRADSYIVFRRSMNKIWGHEHQIYSAPPFNWPL
jgi:hypothetical protein